MADPLGIGVSLPDVTFSGFFSASWIWILVAFLIGMILIGALCLVLFMRTFNRKVIIFENIAGQGFQPTMRTRARIIKAGQNGAELLRTLAGKMYVSAYGRKMGKRTYWFVKGQDGYLYNSILGDLDAKLAILDIEPIDRDVRLLYEAIDRLSEKDYNKRSFMEKYGQIMINVVFIVIFLVGMWVLIGKISESAQALTQTSLTNKEVLETTRNILQSNENILSGHSNSDSGLVPAQTIPTT